MNFARTPASPRVDLLRVAELVAPKSRVLDVGCGDGALLRLLAEERNVDGRGIELSQHGVNDCVAKGLSVIQGDEQSSMGTALTPALVSALERAQAEKTTPGTLPDLTAVVADPAATP